MRVIWAASSLFILISLSICVFLHVCIYVHMWRPEADLECLSSEAVHLVFSESGPLTGTQGLLTRLGWLATER